MHRLIRDKIITLIFNAYLKVTDMLNHKYFTFSRHFVTFHCTVRAAFQIVGVGILEKSLPPTLLIDAQQWLLLETFFPFVFSEVRGFHTKLILCIPPLLSNQEKYYR